MSHEYIGTGYVRGGQFYARGREQFDVIFESWPDCECTITIEQAYATRSLEMNKLYWVGYVKPLCERTGYTRNEMHAYLKQRFLPAHKREMKRMVLTDIHGEVIDDVEIDMSTTTKLNKPEFSEYLHEIAEFGLTLGVECGSNREAA